MGPARLYWEKALALDPTSVALNAMLGFMYCLDARFGWWDDRETALGKARTYADKALARPANADAYRTSSVVLLAQGRFNVFPALKGGDFHCRRRTFSPDTENV